MRNLKEVVKKEIKDMKLPETSRKSDKFNSKQFRVAIAMNNHYFVTQMMPRLTSYVSAVNSYAADNTEENYNQAKKMARIAASSIYNLNEKYFQTTGQYFLTGLIERGDVLVSFIASLVELADVTRKIA